jgi:hypothetical protein
LLHAKDWDLQIRIKYNELAFKKAQDDYKIGGYFPERRVILNRIQYPLLNTMGQHKSDNNNQLIQLTDVFCVLLRYRWVSDF